GRPRSRAYTCLEPTSALRHASQNRRRAKYATAAATSTQSLTLSMLHKAATRATSLLAPLRVASRSTRLSRFVALAVGTTPPSTQSSRAHQARGSLRQAAALRLVSLSRTCASPALAPESLRGVTQPSITL